MGKCKKLKSIIKKYVKVSTYKKIAELLNIFQKRKLYRNIKLSKQEIKETKDYYKKYYGKKIPLWWHRLYTSYTGKFDKKYFPEILFSTKLELIMNDQTKCKVLEDKSLIETLFGNVENLYFPKTFALCCHGIWYNNKREIITYNEAIKELKNVGKCIIKKTIDTSSGRDVKLCNIINGIDTMSNKDISSLIESFKDNFIIQECIHNCKEIAEIYDGSINTFRIITYTINGKIYHTPSVMRIGQNGNFVDNIHAGGLFVGINEEGQLEKYAFSEYQQRFSKHPNTGKAFSDVRIDKFPDVLKIAHRCQCFIPNAGIISWDFAINDKEQITLIEANLFGQGVWISQMANGCSLFGDNTEYMLRLMKGD